MKQFNRATRREIEKKTRKLVQRVDTIEGRCELMRLSEETGVPIFAKCIGNEGANVAICATPDGIKYGTQHDDGFCQFEFYGPDGEHMFGRGGDGMDLKKEVTEW